jgi:hypothetical protein
MASPFTDNARAVESKVTELLTAAGWTKRRFTCAAKDSVYIGKTGTSAGEFIGLYCDWKHDGALHLWPVTDDPVRIAQEVQEKAAALEYPAITWLTNSGGEPNVENLPERIFKQVPFEDGPGDVRPYLVAIEHHFYVMGSLEVSYQDPIWDGLELPTEDVVTKACEAALVAMRATSAPGVIVFPLDFDEMPGRCVISAALPVRDDSSSAVKERLANTFRGFEDNDKLLALAA